MPKQLIGIRYIGKKPFAADNVARSGAIWYGYGDVQHVTDTHAKTLIKYPDQWELADKDDAQDVALPIEVDVKDQDGEQVTIDVATLNKPVERMSKAEIVALAAYKFGKTLDATKPKKMLLDMMEEFEHECAPIADVK